MKVPEEHDPDDHDPVDSIITFVRVKEYDIYETWLDEHRVSTRQTWAFVVTLSSRDALDLVARGFDTDHVLFNVKDETPRPQSTKQELWEELPVLHTKHVIMYKKNLVDDTPRTAAATAAAAAEAPVSANPFDVLGEEDA